MFFYLVAKQACYGIRKERANDSGLCSRLDRDTITMAHLSDPRSPMHYVPLDPHLLDPLTVLDFSLYLFHPTQDRYVLYKSQHQPIGVERLRMLIQHKGRQVFIPVEENAALQRYLTQNLVSIVENPHIPLDEKTNRFHTLASSVMRSLFDSPPDMESFVATAKNVSDSIATLLITEPHAVIHLNQLRSYDYYTFSHSLNVTILTIGLYLDIHPGTPLEKIENLTRGVLLHDIGKCDIPNSILNKKGPLNEEEWIVMKSHTTQGYERLRTDSALTEDSRQVALLHHEALDGTGYPLGLQRNQIPLTSRICKVTDVYDALSSKRSYKNRLIPFDSLLLMTNEMKNKLDMEILHLFILYLNKMGKGMPETQSPGEERQEV